MVEPIRLTAQGDILEVRDGLTDGATIPENVGRHKFCGGTFRCVPTSEHLSALVCDNCYRRVEIQRDITTIGELRAEAGRRALRTDD